MGYVSGLVVMDETGCVLSDYHGTGEAPRQLGEYLDSPALLDAALYPEKRYATRFACEDGSMIDLAAVGRRDAPGVIAAYYRTPVEYLDAFRLSIALMLSGYSPETSGTIVVTGGSRVVASNDETLIGGNAEEMAILRQIRQAYRSDELVRASRPEDSFRRYYGMMGCGRNFYRHVGRGQNFHRHVGCGFLCISKPVHAGIRKAGQGPFSVEISCYSTTQSCAPLNFAAASGTPCAITVSAASAAAPTARSMCASSSFVKFDSTQSARS